MAKIFGLIVLLAFSNLLVFADQVTLKNGDRLTGTILKSDGKTLTLHTDGSSGSQIALTRIDYALAPVYLTIVKLEGNVVLSWPFGTLQEASTVNGTYNDLLSATSPHTNAISGTQKYYRIKVQ